MKKIQRFGGKFGKRSTDDANVGTIIAEFKAMDAMLDKMMADMKTWRNSWEDLLRLQYDASEAFVTLYRAIEPTAHPDMQYTPQETPRPFMQKCSGLQKVHSESKDDLKQETDMIAHKLMRPIEEAKRSTKPMHKTLKHRENMKLDYERYLGKVDSARKKSNPSPKDMQALDMYENDLAQQQISYQTADQQIMETFPPVTDAVLSLLPLMLTVMVELQTTLVGSLYTSLDAYCRAQNLPSPAPSDAEIVRKWDSEFTSMRYELEQSLQTLKGGKAIHLGMSIPQESGGIRGRISNLGGRKTSDNTTTMPLRITNGASRSPHGSYRQDDDEEEAPPQPPRPPMSRSPSALSVGSSMGSPPPIPGGKPRAPMPRTPSSQYLAPHNAPYDQRSTARIPSVSSQPDRGASPSRYASPPESYTTAMSTGRLSPALSTATSATGEYFDAHNRNAASPRRPSSNYGATPTALIPGGGAGAYTPGLSEILAAKAKKKPPPPVPMKKIAVPQQQQYVTALYDFDGQGPADLPFREGDRIRVTKKTGSQDDWWDGELRGRTGTFPANYVQV